MKAVAYFRVSTEKQGRSGLGLDAQKKAVRDHVQQSGGTILREFKEIESGKRADRPELRKALAHARRTGATLVVAKLDRLSRNVAFLATLMESKVDFVACDNPHANRFTVHILAAVAEHEREMISKRTKDALAAARDRGVLLGSDREGHWTPERHEKRLEALERGRRTAARSHRQNALDEYQDITPLVLEMRERGDSLRAIAAALNSEGWTTRRGRPFQAATIRNLLVYSRT